VTSDLSLASRTVLVTGATSGVGLEAARQLAQLGPRLLIIGEQIKSELERNTPHLTVQAAELDLESLSSVDSFVDELSANSIRLDLAVLNAGFFAHDDRITEDGYSPLFQVNFLSTAYLALRLLPLLHTMAPPPPTSSTVYQGPTPPGPRLVLVTSEAHAWTTFPDVPGPTDNRTLPILSVFRDKNTLGSADDQYARAKLLLALFGKELSRRLTAAENDTTVVITTPGFCASNFFPDGMMTRLIQFTSARSAKQGGALHVFAATAQGSEIHGAYLRDGKPTR
jgi:NAD(P)-dependent dehydrogenase (short-subunit alcohol dehydrogenase family)